MRRLFSQTLLALCILVLGASLALAGGSCTSKLSCYGNGYQCKLTYTCTGSSVDGNFTSATGMSASTSNLSTLAGYFLFIACSDPGSTAPTASWDYTFTDAHRDLLGGLGANHSATASECFVPKIDTTNNIFGAVPWVTSLTLAITGNSVASAGIVFDFYFVKE